jgi:hypothetical protein
MRQPRNVSGRHFVLDTHIIDDPSEAAIRLRQLGADGLVYLSRTDTMDTELLGATPDKQPVLLELSGRFVEHLGPFVLDHSLFDHAVLGGDEDEARLRQVFEILFPHSEWDSVGRQHVRDAMHIATAIRYGADGFVTNERRLLRAKRTIQDAFNGFLLVDPAGAVTIVDRLTTRALHRLASSPSGRPWAK